MKFLPKGRPDGHYPVDGKTWYPFKDDSRRDDDRTANFIIIVAALLTLYILWRVAVLWVNDTPWALWIVHHVAAGATWIWSLF